MTTFNKGDKVFVSETAVWGCNADPVESLRGQVGYVARATLDGDGDITVSLDNNDFNARYVRATDVSIAEGERVTVSAEHFSCGGNGTVVEGRDSQGEYWVKLDNGTKSYVSDDKLDYLREDEQPTPTNFEVGDTVRVAHPAGMYDGPGFVYFGHETTGTVMYISSSTNVRVRARDFHGVEKTQYVGPQYLTKVESEQPTSTEDEPVERETPRCPRSTSGTRCASPTRARTRTWWATTPCGFRWWRR